MSSSGHTTPVHDPPRRVRQKKLFETWDVPDVARPVVTLPRPAAASRPLWQPTESTGLLVIDLFCGIGGFSTGAAMAGHQVVLAVDSEYDLLAIHQLNHPDAEHLKLELGPDTEHILEAKIRALVPTGRPFHVHGSPPCTKLSNMQNVKHSDELDENVEEGLRLVMWFIDFVQRLNPTTWSFEQVPIPQLDGVLRYAQYLLPDKCAYCKSVDFSRMGIPQARQRVIAGSPPLVHRLLTEESFYSSAPTLADILPNTPPEATLCLASTGRVADPTHNVLQQDGSFSNDTVRRGCYRSLNCIAPTCCAGYPLRWCRADHSTIRAFSVREQATVQTFPPAYRFGTSKQLAYKGIGNAIPPQFAKLFMSMPA